MKKKLIDLLKTVPVYQVDKLNDQLTITGLTIDSRQVKKGDLFICIQGYTVDGHAFAKQAEAAGASAIIAEKNLTDIEIPVIYVKDTNRVLALLANHFYDYPTNKMHVTGVTGTNGKTSVTYLLDEIYRMAKRKTGVIGTIQMKIGEKAYPVQNTTPESSFLQKNLNTMVEEKIEHVMMEVSSHALDLGRVNGCDFDVAIYTNLTQDHLDYHKDMDSYKRAKMRLFYQLGNRYDPNRPKYAIINADDQYSDSFSHATSQPVITYGINKKADVQAENLRLTANGTAFKLKTFKGTIDIETHLMGKFNVYNMLAAAAAALVADVSLATIKTALDQSKGVRGRFEAVLSDQPFGVIVDYAHTPDSLDNVLATIKSFAKGKVYVVVGCGGDRDRTKRPLMAKVAEKHADLTLLTSDNPRSEDPVEIIQDMVTGMDTDCYLIETDRKQAIFKAVQLAKAEDIILIAGKGHETYQIIGDDVLDFDDYQMAELAIDSISKMES